MAAMNDNSPFNTRVLFNLEDLGIDPEFFYNRDNVTMASEKYICVRETNSIVIIDVAKPTQPIRLPITADSAIMNPNTPILAFKVEANIHEATSQDQLQMYDINTKTTLKSCNLAEKVECCKWITPRLLGLVTLKAVYHWSIQDPTGPVKMFDITDVVAKSKINEIRNYMLDPSEKWVVLMGYNKENCKNYRYYNFARPYQGGDQWFSFYAHATAFTTSSVKGNKAPSTLLCSAAGKISNDEKKTRCIELSVHEGFDSHQGEPDFRKKHDLEFNITDTNSFVRAVQTSQKYGLIYVITQCGLISIHDLETTEAICSYNIIDCKTNDDLIICTIEDPSSTSLYAINKRGDVLLTSLNGWAILSFVNDKLLSTRGNLHDLQELCMAMSSESEELIKQNTELQNASAIYIRETEKQITGMRTKLCSYQKSQEELLVEIEGLKAQNAELQSAKEELIRETEEQLTSMRTKLNNFLNETLNEIDGLKKEISKLEDERDKIIKNMDESLQLETNTRREIQEQLTNKMIELTHYQKSQEDMMHTIERLKMQNAELINDRDKYMRNPVGFHSLVESNNLVENFLEFTEEELRQATNNFNDSNKIFEGEHGTVYKALLGLKPVAIKILRHESYDEGIKFNQEVSISSKLRHPNLVMLLGACIEKQALIYELMPNGFLHDILRNKNQSINLTWKTRIHIASNICSGLICLHSAKPQSIVHGNLKSTNILLDSNYTAKLSDFGTFGHLQQNGTVIVPHHLTMYPKGALPYIDPEYFSTNELTTQSDVYSFGIVLLELVSGRDPMGLRKSLKDALRKEEHFVDATAGEWPSEEAKRMVLLGLRCSDPSAENRPDLVNEVLVEIESMRLASLRF